MVLRQVCVFLQNSLQDDLTVLVGKSYLATVAKDHKHHGPEHFGVVEEAIPVRDVVDFNYFIIGQILSSSQHIRYVAFA